MVMGNGSCLPDQSYEMAMQPPCLYWTSVDQQFYDVGDGSRLNLCGSVDLMADVLFHSSLLQESQTLNINPMTTDAGGGGVLSGGTSATASLELNPVLGPTTTSSVDLPCSSIPPALQDALWWMTSSDLLSAALMAPTPNNTATTAPQDASSGGASPHLDIPVESASGYLPAVCKDEAGVSLQPSGILSHCAGNTAGHGCAVGVWRDLTATCCTSGNATSSGDSQESSEMYGHGGSYTNSGRSCGAAAVVDISFQPVTSRTQLVNDAAAIISSSPYNLGSLQADNAKGRRKQQQGCSRGSGGPLLQYAVNTTTAAGTSFSIDFENPTCTASTKPSKRPRSADRPLSSSASRRPSTPSIDFRSADTLGSASPAASYEPDPEAVAHVKEMIYRAAAFRPVNLGPEAVDRPRRKNVRISSDPQTVAARHRRERISERLRVLQRLVPGGSKMDTASMLDEAANYLKFLKSQVTVLEGMGTGSNNRSGGSGFRNAIMNAASTSSCGGIPLLPSSILGSSSSLTRMDHGFSIPTQISTPKTIPSQLRDHSIELGNRALH